MVEDRKHASRFSVTDDKSSRPSFDHNKNPVSALESSTGEPEQAPWKQRVVVFLENIYFTIWMVVLTLFALFGDDIRACAFGVSADVTFYCLTIICLFFFTFELTLSSICKPDYFLGFYFWLDLISTVSLITDIGWVWDAMVGTSSSSSSAAKTAQIARAGRASRAGTRVARIIRIIRIIRLIRIVRIYREAKATREKNLANKLIRGVVNYRAEHVKRSPVQVVPEREFVDEDSANGSLSMSFSENHNEEVFSNPEASRNSDQGVLSPVNGAGNEVPPEALEEKLHEESKVGKELSELTTRRVILLVLGILCASPLFVNQLYVDDNTSYVYGLDVMNTLVNNNTNFRQAWNSYISQHQGLATPLVKLEVYNMDLWETDLNLNDLRSSEQGYYVLSGVDVTYKYYSYSVFDLRYSTRMDAYLNICQTLFICIVLVGAVAILSRDAQKLVLTPIENMMEKVQKISLNPLGAAQEQERKEVMDQIASLEQAKLEESHEANKKVSRLKICCTKKKAEEEEPMETVFLEKTLNKIGALLALGFGEAGSEIIATNMQKGGGEVDPMIPGKKTHCIFGFCDIRDFADTTEVLQQEVLMFVNEIAFIVHKTVDFFSGNANKNIGDAFLLVWKFPEAVLLYNDDTKGCTLAKDQYVNQLADMAVISFLKIIAEIHKNPRVLKYRQHAGLNSRLPGFTVKMGFGLHQGWAIEGAIGSEFKIDASYLSPNVNMASRLEAATKQFGVHILISSALYDICSHNTRSRLRRVDKVTVKGSKQPIELYTCDVYPQLLKPAAEDVEKPDIKKIMVMGRIARDKMRDRAMIGEFNASNLWDEDDDLIIMRSSVSKAFIKEFGIALQDYLDGKWTEAKAGFKRAQDLKGSVDGPCQVLIEFIQSEGGVAPANWPGYRELHDK